MLAAYRRTGAGLVPRRGARRPGRDPGHRRLIGRGSGTEWHRSSSPRRRGRQDYLVRRWAEQNWPELAARWGRAAPIATGRSAQDYRDLVRRFVVAPDSVARPKVFIETEQRGVIEVELFGPEAPMTVANFLRLVDRRFFDGNRWHRVVPNFVVQDGDPRGDGFGGPGVRSGTRSIVTGTMARCWAWRSPGRIPGPASGSSPSVRSHISTAPTPSSGG